MRLPLLIGIALIAIGLAALYQTKNGFLMSSIGKAYYAPPPEEHEALKAAFKDLGAKGAAENGYLLRQVARARVICAMRQTNEQPNAVSAEAFRRLNLMMLGAGVGEFSSVIDPSVHYIGEIRGSLLRETTAWRTGALSRGEVSRLDGLFENLTAVKHPAYADLPLGDGFNHFVLKALVEAMRDAGEAVNACVATGKNA